MKTLNVFFCINSDIQLNMSAIKYHFFLSPGNLIVYNRVYVNRSICET